MLINFKLLHVWFPYTMAKNWALILWIALHIYFYTAYVAPAEKKLIGEVDGDKEE